MTGRVRTTTAVGPRPVWSPIAHRHHRREVADAVCEGRFALAGRTVRLGTDPDWRSPALPADEEWRIEWTKFYWGLDLANAFAETGDRRYLETWLGLVRSWIRRVPVGFDSADVAARRIQNWIAAWSIVDAVSGFPRLKPDDTSAILRSLGEHAGYVRANLDPERNHRTLELAALSVFAMAFPGEDPDGALLAFAVDELDRDLCESFRPDGVHREHSTHYHMVALRSHLALRRNAARFGIRLPQRNEHRLHRAVDFAIHCRRPDGGIPALSDADGGDHADLLLLAADVLGREDARYAATGGREGTRPRAAHASFPDAGYFVQRSGWRDANERFLVFDCGPLGDGGHGHYDQLSVEIAAGGRPLIVDPGRFTYSEDGPENLRRWFKGTAAHNTVTVDGLDQVPYRRGKPKGPLPEAWLVERRTARDADLLVGRAVSPSHEVAHTRSVLFAGGRSWLIEDRLEGERPHRFDLRFHLHPGAQDRTRLDRRPDGAVVRAPGVALLVAPGFDEIELEPGWVSELYGERRAAPVVRVTRESVPAARFLTAVVPVDEEFEP